MQTPSQTTRDVGRGLPPGIPPRALAGMGDWEAVVVWSRAPEVVTWRLLAPGGELRYLKLARLGQERSLAEEQARMVWAAAHLPVPQVLGSGADGTYEWLLTAALVGVNAVDASLRADPRRLVPLLADGQGVAPGRAVLF